MNLRPELLLHPLIPPPLHGIAPREILGSKWWDAERKEAYKKNNNKCWACGTHKEDKSCSCNGHFAYKTYLEGHESYIIDYEEHTVELLEVVALCHSCHNFIHNGRLLLQYRNGTISRQYVENILNHGITILSRGNLKPTANQAHAWLTIVKGYSTEDALTYIINRGLEQEKFNPENWTLWKLKVGDAFYSGMSKETWVNKYG